MHQSVQTRTFLQMRLESIDIDSQSVARNLHNMSADRTVQIDVPKHRNKTPGGRVQIRAAIPTHDVAWPVVAREPDPGSLCQTANLFAKLAGTFLKKVPCQDRQIVFSLGERWYSDFNHREPVIQILAEQLLR